MFLYILLFEVRFHLNYFFRSKSLNNNLLVIQLSGIGDAIICLPLLKYLNIVRNLNLTVLTNSNNFKVFSGQNFINTILVDDGELDLLNILEVYHCDHILSVRSPFKFAFPLFKFRGNFYPNPHYERVRIFSRILSLFSFRYKKYYYSRTHTINLFSDYFNLNEKFKSLISIDSELLPDSLNKFISSNSANCVLFHFIGNDSIRKLDRELIYSVINDIRANLIIVGGPNDVDYINLDTLDISKHYNAIGQLNIAQIYTLCMKINYCIVVDSSIMHIASINSNMKMVSIMGNAMVGNYGPMVKKENLRVLHRNPTCSPCSTLYCIKYNGKSCVQDIRSSEILDAFNSLKL